MSKTAKEVVEHWRNNTTDKWPYPSSVMNDIALNCLALSKTWTEKTNGNTFVLRMVKNDGYDSDTLYGVSKETLPDELYKLLLAKGAVYKFVILEEHVFSPNNNKKDIVELGSIEIS